MGENKMKLKKLLGLGLATVILVSSNTFTSNSYPFASTKGFISSKISACGIADAPTTIFLFSDESAASTASFSPLLEEHPTDDTNITVANPNRSV